MVVSNNIIAMNAQRQFNIVGLNKKKSTEKLASGYKINRAADDAAGLTISEKMRSQIRALNQGADNIQDGISLCNVADGALTEIHDMLHRENELIIKAANGTNTQEDLEAIQTEIDALNAEIDRIFESTEFNTIKLFKGESLKATTTSTKEITADDIVWIDKGIQPSDSSKLVKLDESSELIQKIKTLSIDIDGNIKNLAGTIFVNNASEMLFSNGKNMSTPSEHFDFDVRLINGNVYTGHNISAVVSSGMGNNRTEKLYFGYTGFSIEINTKINENSVTQDYYLINNSDHNDSDTFDFYVYNKSNYSDFKNFASIEYSSDNKNYETEGCVELLGSGMENGEVDINIGDKKKFLSVTTKINIDKDAYMPTESEYDVITDKGIIIQTNGVANSNKQIPIKLYNLSAEGLSLKSGKDVTVYDTGKSLENINNGIASISELRSYYGATTNRLEHAYRNNQNISENTTAAESRIRDTDMAKEIVNLSLLNILEQAGLSMMSQANQSNQGVLSLLQ